MIAGLQRWFAALSRREQLMVGGAALLGAAVIGYYGIYTPLYAGATGARTAFYDATEDRARIAGKVERLKQPARTGTESVAMALNLVMDSEAAERGFTLERNQPSGNDRVDIAIPSARSGAFFAWLADLEKRGVVAQNLSVRRTDAGTVAVTATLTKAGAR